MGVLQTRLTRIVLVMKILLICNYKPGVGGISGQVELLQKYLRTDGHLADIFNTKVSFWQRLLAPMRLLRTAKGYDILHIHCCSEWGFLPAVLGVSIGRRLRKRIVLTYHGGGGELFFARHPRLVRHYLTRTNQNIVLSGFLAKVFDNHNIPYTVIPNIIELDETQYRERTSLKPRFICVRSHENLYNIPCILRAFKQVQSELPDATLTLVGDGSQHTALKLMAEEMQLNNVSFTGRVDNSQIYNYLNRADVMLSTPKVDNMPVSLLEAMNAGLLVISTNVGGVPFIIDDGNDGLLIPSDDHTSLANCMTWTINNQSKALAITKKAHLKVLQYQWCGIKDIIYSTYGIHS